MPRSPIVADRFYPGDPVQLAELIDELCPTVEAKQQALALVSPHAGYIYSGAVAAETLAQAVIPRTVLLIGPNHTGRGAAVALSQEDWETPLGRVDNARALGELLLQESPLVTADEEAHQFEHSLEVQLPLLQTLRPDVQVLPLTVSHLSQEECRDLGRALARSIRGSGEQVLILASSDMSHYESREEATRKDQAALERLLALDPKGLYQKVTHNRISMCGIMPVTVALTAALELGAGRAELVRYTDSGAISGDIDQVVGYAGVIIA